MHEDTTLHMPPYCSIFSTVPHTSTPHHTPPPLTTHLHPSRTPPTFHTHLHPFWGATPVPFFFYISSELHYYICFTHFLHSYLQTIYKQATTSCASCRRLPSKVAGSLTKETLHTYVYSSVSHAYVEELELRRSSAFC